MGLIDASLLGNVPTGNNTLGAFMQGQQAAQGLVQFGQQQRSYAREMDFLQALDEEVKNAGDFTTPEGQKKIVAGLAKRGYGREAQQLAEKLPQPAPKTYEFKEAGQDYGAFDPNKGTFNKLGTKPQEPKTQTANPEMKTGRDGYYHVWDPETKQFKNTGLLAPKDEKPKTDSGIKPEHVFTMEQKLSNDFRADAGKSIDVATANSKINEALNQNNPLDAYNAIVQFVKIIDPGTAAREGEVKSAVLSSAGGAGAKLIQAAKSAYNGTLNPETIKNVRESAAALMRGEKKTFDAKKRFFESKIESYNKRGYGLDRSAILGDYDSLFQEPAAPKAITEADIDKMGAEELKAFLESK